MDPVGETLYIKPEDTKFIGVLLWSDAFRILQMFRNYIPPCLQRTTYGAYKTCDLYNEETVFDYIAFNVI